MGKKKKDNHTHSAVKCHPEKDLVTGKIPLDWKEMSHQEAFQTCPEFALHDGDCRWSCKEADKHW